MKHGPIMREKDCTSHNQLTTVICIDLFFYWLQDPADHSPLLGCLNEFDFPAIHFLSRQFLKGVFQVTVRGKLNNPVKSTSRQLVST